MSTTVSILVNSSASLADVDPGEPIPFSLTPAASSPCPAWCALGPVDSQEHNGGPRATVHRSVEALLAGPCDGFGENVAVRAEIYSLEEEGERQCPAVIYVQGESDFELTSEQADVFIADAEQFLATLRVLRAQMEG
ncbi:DUF6907 domain-containing protein [Streptomyces boninensis]|uniref:DUF6907 domain-containing protein n=1 Tax=Streptomyces boninensis TaxID=2039455 RepID=UPI003B21F2AA